ncbi:MAG: hypothetical protein EVA37_02745, partial [Flavobacteriales bacterium]
MKRTNILFKSIAAFIIALAMVSCEIDSFSEESQFEFGDITAPSNLTLSAEIVGGGTGDGSGVVHFTASATGALNYKFVYNGQETIASDGKMTYNFAIVGTHDYTVSVIAMGIAGTQTSLSQTITVLSLYDPPAELVSVLSDKPLRILAEEGAHFGVGPLDATSGVWYAANPYDKETSGMYDDRYSFSAYNSGGTFSHNTGADGEVFGKAPALQRWWGDKGAAVNACCNEHENYPLDSYDSAYTLSAPGGVETISIEKGFLGFCVANGNYQILARTSTTLFLKTTYADEN